MNMPITTYEVCYEFKSAMNNPVYHSVFCEGIKECREAVNAIKATDGYAVYSVHAIKVQHPDYANMEPEYFELDSKVTQSDYWKNCKKYA